MAAGSGAEPLRIANRQADTGAAPAGMPAARTAAIAARWSAAIAATSFGSWSATDVAARLRAWTGQLGDLLLAESGDPEPARAIGAALARLHYLRPAALEATLTVLGEELAVGLPAARQARLAALLGALAAGFSEQARRTILGEQEAIRRAAVAERDALATALRRSEARYRTIFEQAALGIARFDAEGRLLESNPALAAMLGYSAEELRARPFSSLTHPDDMPATLRLYQELVAGPRAQAQMEKRYRRRDGSLLWAHLTVSLVRDAAGAPLFAAALIKDVTARKQAEALAHDARRRLHAAGEAERLRLARELHDGPLQDLEGVLLRVRLSATAGDLGHVAGEPTVAEKLLEVIRTLRAVCTELRPPTLTQLGLAAAIRAQADRCAAGHPELGLRLELAEDGDRLPEPARLALYRIYQQALCNIIQHARARAALVRLVIDEEQVLLEVRDDGCGFEVPGDWSAMAQAGHLGLLGAQERAESIGGQLDVCSAPGVGTRLRVIAPRGPGAAGEVGA